MSMVIRPTHCKRCGKSLSIFEGKYCLECQTVNTIPMSVIEDIIAEMKSCIGYCYRIDERETRDGTKFIDCGHYGHYDTGTIEQMIKIIDKHIGGDANETINA